MRGRCLTAISRLASVSASYIHYVVLETDLTLDIADVSRFVHPDTPMDNEAAARGTTVYLVDKRIDMLPALLGTNLCSLRPFVERLAFSVIWVSFKLGASRSVLTRVVLQEMTSEAEIVSVGFGPVGLATEDRVARAACQTRHENKCANCASPRAPAVGAAPRVQRNKMGWEI